MWQHPPQREMSSTSLLLANMRSIFSSRWTDADLLCVLNYANGNFVVAVDSILRHEATGQPPGELIRHLSGWGGMGAEDNFPRSPRRSYFYNMENSPHHDVGAGLIGCGCGGCGGGALRQVESGISNEPTFALDSVGATSNCFLPPSSISSSLFERVVIKPDDCMRYPHGESYTATAVPRRKSDASAEQGPGIIGYPSSSFGASTSPIQSAISRFSDLNIHDLSQREKDELLLQLFSRSRRRHRQPPDASLPTPKKHQQGPSAREMDMLNIQAGIEASLKQTRIATETNLDDDAISYAVKASKETFNEEFQQMQLRNALERRLIKMLLVQSLSDPVKKSEEEYMTKAMAESLADPALKSEETEEELVNKALAESLADEVQKSEYQLIEEAMENSLEDPIRVSEEELMEEAMQKSLQTMSEEEDLVEAVKLQSLKYAFGSVGKTPARASMPNRRISSDTSCRWSLTEDDMSEGSIDVDHSPPQISNSSLIDSSFLDRKMPAQVLTETVTKSSSNSEISSQTPASTGFTQDKYNAGANVAQHLNESECLRSLIVEGASFSLVNGVYEEVEEQSKIFTRRMDWGGVIATASIYQISTQDCREWVLSVANFNCFPGSEMDVILFTASVDSFNEDLPSHFTNWVGVSHIVQGGSPPKVTEL